MEDILYNKTLDSIHRGGSGLAKLRLIDKDKKILSTRQEGLPVIVSGYCDIPHIIPMTCDDLEA